MSTPFDQAMTAGFSSPTDPAAAAIPVTTYTSGPHVIPADTPKEEKKTPRKRAPKNTTPKQDKETSHMSVHEIAASVFRRNFALGNVFMTTAQYGTFVPTTEPELKAAAAALENAISLLQSELDLINKDIENA